MPQIEVRWKATLIKNTKKLKWINPEITQASNNDSSDNEEERTSLLDTYSQHGKQSIEEPRISETAKMDITTMSDPETSESNTQEVTLSSLLSEL